MKQLTDIAIVGSEEICGQLSYQLVDGNAP